MTDITSSHPGFAGQAARNGFIAALVAHTLWGLVPLYLHLLVTVPATQIMAHRLVWCCAVVFLWLLLRRGLAPVWAALANPATRWRLGLSALLISINWLLYVWAVNNGHVVESSLGYFINPLINVALGVALLGERLSPLRWSAVVLAACGVVYLTVMQGRPPWIALVLGTSFGLYGLIRKVIPVEAIEGLAAETALVTPLGVAYLVWCEVSGSGVMLDAGWHILLLLLAGGLVTAIPLSLFAYGARRIPYSTIGLIQYIGPSIQILLGIFFFHEAFTSTQALGYGLIWLALALYASDSLWRQRGITGSRVA